MIRFICIFFLFYYSNIFSKESYDLYIADDSDYAPFVWKDPSTEKPRGIHFDIMTEAFRRMGKKLRFEVYPWKRSILYVKTGQADALITTPTVERLKTLVPSESTIVTINNRLFINIESPLLEPLKKVKSLQDLKPYTLIDYSGNGWAKSNLIPIGLKVDWSTSFSSALLKLSKNRGGEIFVQDEYVTKFNLKKLGITDKIIFVPGVSIKSGVFKLLVKKDPKKIKILKEFDKTFKIMQKDGTLFEIYSKYR